MNYHFPLSQKTMSGVLRNANHSCHDIFNRGSLTDEGKIFFGCMGISVVHFIVAPGPLKLLDIGPLEAEFMGTLVGLKIVNCPF
jgi:hypothetical protein